jgi:general secretion pathway protein J
MLDRCKGFTLLELLVAMGIFAIIGAMAMGGLNAIIGQSTQAQENTARLAKLQRAMRLLTNDLGSLEPRSARNDRIFGSERLKPYATNDLEYVIQGTRGGWRNPAGLPFRGTQQRFQYRLDDDKLYREYWPSVDHYLTEKPKSEELLTGVKSFKVWSYASPQERFDRWPPTRTTVPTEDRPKAIQVILELEDWGEIERWVEVTQ